MRRITLVLMSVFTAICAMSTDLLVGTYNIRCDVTSDRESGNGWQQRCPQVCALVGYESPDVWGAQEVFYHQLQDIIKLLPEYGYVGVGRDDGDQRGECSPVFYRRDRFEVVDSGHFWLSDTPWKPSLGWDGACVRICSWVHLRHLADQNDFFYFNLHLDHVGEVARRNAATLVLSRIGEIAQGGTVILTGDFNVDQHDEVYQQFATSGLLNDSYEVAQRRLEPNGTFNNYDFGQVSKSRIDHVFVSPNVSVERYGILTNIYWSDGQIRMPSDHYPVFVKIRF